ncbi:hypothetical protein [Bacillus sp. FJAT-49736]|uniref:hypothetical protein n=1 Tax=Bacillus sp. FJAT-49736 TaxID=2833582 RepID=UPI001BC9EEF5|nr:hypothetical protein [Bacillus sp. FJAT-49736]MBS4175857.1 hypothetical protein [Bacillus sp. FJAT-49736]
MQTTILSQIVKPQIKRHKRMFEKYQCFNYIFRYKNNDYHYVAYYTSKKSVKGILIVTKDGTIAERNEAIKICRMINNYNNLIVSASRKLYVELNRPTEVMYHTKRWLELYFNDVNYDIDPIKPDIDQIYYSADTFINGQKQLLEINDFLVKSDKDVRLTNHILTEEHVKEAEQVLSEYSLVIHKQGVTQWETIDSIKKVLKFIEENESNSNKKEYKSLRKQLLNYIHPRNIKRLQMSLDNYIDKRVGSVFDLPKGEAGIEAFKELDQKETEYCFQHDILPLLRN